MYVRVVSNVSRMLYQSMVYAVVNGGWDEQYIVLNPQTNDFELVEYLDKTVALVKPLVYNIQQDSEGFMQYTGATLLKFKYYCKNNQLKDPELSGLFGYPNVCENYAFLYDIITHKKVPVGRYDIQLRDIPDVNEWTYIKTQKDADEFMDLFAGFHDSQLISIQYSEENGKKEATAIFDNTCWFGIAELCFEGVLLLKIVPPVENCLNLILDASLFVADDGVFWTDDYMEKPDESYGGSIIRAFSLKWRKK